MNFGYVVLFIMFAVIVGLSVGLSIEQPDRRHTFESMTVHQKQIQQAIAREMPEFFPIQETGPAFCITLRKRPERWKAFLKRMGPWISGIKRVFGTDGAKIDRQQWINEGKVMEECSISNNEMGCYDSHRRCWKEIAENEEHERGFVIEDDINLHHMNIYKRKLIMNAIAEISKLDPNWGVLYVGWNPNYRLLAEPYGKYVSHMHGPPCGVAYILRKHAAQILTENAFPIRSCCDTMMKYFHNEGYFTTYIVRDNVAWIDKNVGSDLTLGRRQSVINTRNGVINPDSGKPFRRNLWNEKVVRIPAGYSAAGH